MSLRQLVRPIATLQSSRSASAAATKQILESAPAAHVTSLKNGFRVVSEDNGKPTVTIGIFVENGSRFETQQNSGVSSFLEHLLYKGTNKRTQQQLETELAGLGASLSSETGRDHTAYYVQAASKDVEKVVDIVADILRNPKLDAAAVEKERQVLLNKLDELEGNYQNLTFDMLHTTAFQGTGLAHYPHGTTKSIQEITADQIRQWQADNYRPVRMVLSAVGGGAEHGKLVGLAEKYFGDLSNEYPGKVPSDLGIRFTGSEFRFRNDKFPAMFAAIAVEGVGYGHADALPLAVVANGIGQWDATHGSSHNAPKRHVQRLVEGYGLHGFEQFNINYKNTGLWGVYFVADGKDFENVTNIHSIIQKEWKHMACALEAQEVEGLINQYRNRFFSKVESNTGKAKFNAKELLYTGHLRSLADVEEQLSNLSANSIGQAMNRHIYDRDIATAGVGRTEGFPEYSYIRQRMWWWRL
ncbi:unnamed protein product, partial [Mesorhabditis belari]|uniref:Uncharacterized protein n=1 Tax=Mesorhabditis belari TaxID=2138241 RepID=A0AAF3FEX1_9BILA